MLNIIGFLIFGLLAGHFMADYVFQNDTISREKRRASNTELQKIVPWYYWLTAHAFTHGFFVWFVTGNWILGFAETFAHWIIDFGKCEGWYGLKFDQFLHIFCKLLWISYILMFLNV